MVEGHSIALYWQAVQRFFVMRARLYCRRLRVPLVWCQAADDVKGLEAQPVEVRKSVLQGLCRWWNINETGHLHMLLPLHVGMRVRLTEKLSAEDNLVQEAEGTVLAIVMSRKS